MSIVISYGTPDDTEQLANLIDLYRKFYGEKSDINLSLQFIRERLYLGDTKVILAKIEDNVIGFVQLFPSFSTVTLQRLWILNDLYVVETWRSQEVGLKLLQAAKSFALKHGAKQLFIEGAKENTELYMFTRNLGL